MYCLLVGAELHHAARSSATFAPPSCPGALCRVRSSQTPFRLSSQLRCTQVLFDSEFSGGTDLYGRCHGSCGALLPAAELLNLSKPHAVRAEGAAAPHAVRRGAAAPAAPAAAAAGAAAAQRAAAAAQQRAGKGGAGGAAAALAAAAAALAGPAANGSAAAAGAGGFVRPAGGAAAAPPQPRIPDESGARGFTMGRGRAAAASKPVGAPAQPQPPKVRRAMLDSYPCKSSLLWRGMDQRSDHAKLRQDLFAMASVWL